MHIPYRETIWQKYTDDNGFHNAMFFVDDGYSDTNFDRPDWQRLMVLVKEGKVGTVIVKDMSRLGRDYLKVGYSKSSCPAQTFVSSPSTMAWTAPIGRTAISSRF